MTHINYNRNVDQISALRLNQVVTPEQSGTSFGAFCGLDVQRLAVGLRKIGLNCGRIGVVLVHDDLLMDVSLPRIFQDFPNLQREHPNFRMYRINPSPIERYYDPLYGLTVPHILDAIAPTSDIRQLPAIQQVRSLLSDYLEIMRLMFDENSRIFGDHPYNLDLLYTLTRMPFSDLDTQVLAFLPPQHRRPLAGRLNVPNGQQQVFHFVQRFATDLHLIWNQSDPGMHTRLSVIQAVRQRNLVSIQVPNSDPKTLDYLSAELRMLNQEGIPYLLVADNVMLRNSESFTRLFLDGHVTRPYSTGILAPGVNCITNDSGFNQQLAALFGQTQQLFVFQCPSTMDAAPFSDAMGDYFRMVVNRDSGSTRRPFGLFGDHHTGVHRQESQQKIITPYQLTALGTGCLYCDKDQGRPTLANHFLY